MKRIICTIAILAVLVFCLWMVLRRPKLVPEQTSPHLIATHPTNGIVALLNSNRPPPLLAATNLFVRPDSIDEDHWNRLMQMRQMILEENQPIEFYARVLDQNGQPVEGATLQIGLSRIDEKLFETTNFFRIKMGDEVVHLSLELVSDADGWIKTNGVTGKNLRVKTLAKEGYSWTMPQIGSFSYEPDGQRRVGNVEMEDAFNPAKGYVFHLLKE